jgi:hypothetical protein
MKASIRAKKFPDPIRAKRWNTMMTGKVTKIEEGAVHVELQKGLRCWFDPMDESTIEIGDVVTGNLWSLEVLELFNETRGHAMKVFMQGHVRGDAVARGAGGQPWRAARFSKR